MESRLNSNPNSDSSNESWNAVGPRVPQDFPRSTTVVSEQPGSPQEQQKSRGHVWARRTFMVILVLFCIELGMALVVLPWLSVWTANSLLQGYPQAQVFLGNYFVRGAFTGLGLIDIWIGVWEAVHYRDHPEP